MSSYSSSGGISGCDFYFPANRLKIGVCPPDMHRSGCYPGKVNGKRHTARLSDGKMDRKKEKEKTRISFMIFQLT